MVVRLDGSVLAGPGGPVLRSGVDDREAGDGVAGLAGSPACGGVFPPAGDLDGWRAQRKSGRPTWAAFTVRVSMRPRPVSRVVPLAGTCRQGSGTRRSPRLSARG